MKDIYDLKLHELTIGGNCIILKVPGGWIYTPTIEKDGKPDELTYITSLFIPFSKEFAPKTKSDIKNK